MTPEEWAQATPYTEEQWKAALEEIRLIVGDASADKIVHHNHQFYAPEELVDTVKAMVKVA